MYAPHILRAHYDRGADDYARALHSNERVQDDLVVELSRKPMRPANKVLPNGCRMIEPKSCRRAEQASWRKQAKNQMFTKATRCLRGAKYFSTFCCSAASTSAAPSRRSP